MRVLLLGPVEAVDDAGHRLLLGGPRQRGVLAALAVHHPRSIPVDQLIEQVWGDDAPAQALVSLRSYVANLRRILDPGRRPGETNNVVVTDGAGYRLARDVGVDAIEFEALLGEARASLAAGDGVSAVAEAAAGLALWRGPSLADVSDERFARDVVIRLDELRLVALEVQAEARLVAYEAIGTVVADLEGLVAAYPLRERLWALLMVALYRSGRQADALRAFTRVRVILAEELGLDPSPPLVALEQAVLAHDIGAIEHAIGLTAPLRAATRSPVGGEVADDAPTGAPLTVPGFPSTLSRLAVRPIVGRRHELHVAAAACAAPRLEPSGATVIVVRGSAGIGKSRLAAALAASCHDRDAVVLYGRWDASPLRAYQAVAEAVSGLLAAQNEPLLRSLTTRRLRVLARLAPDVVQPILTEVASDRSDGSDPEVVGAVERFLVLDAVGTVLAWTAATRPLLLILEDVQWADEASWALLEHLARTIAASEVTIVLTCRTGEGRPADVSTRLTLLDRSTDVVRIDLDGLTPDEIAELVTDQTDQRYAIPALDGATAAAVARASEGNPLFALQLARRLHETGDSDFASAGLPDEIHALLGARLAALPDAVAATVRAAAVLGAEFDLGVLAAIGRSDEAATLDDLEQAVHAEVLVESADVADRFRFAHGLLHDVARAQLTAARRRRLHHAAGLHLRAAASRDPSTRAAVAHHLLAARPVGDTLLAASAAADAAADAFTATAYERAAWLFEQAATVGGDVGDAVVARRWIDAGRAHTAAGAAVAARTAFMQAVNGARAAGSATILADAVLGVGGEWVSAGTADAALVTLLDEALASAERLDDGTTSRLVARKAAAYFFAGHIDDADRLSAEALVLAEGAGDDRGAAAALHCRHLVARVRVPAADRLELARSVVARADKAGDATRATVGLADEIFDRLEAGELPSVDELVRSYEERANRTRRHFDQWWLAVHRAMRALLDGRWDDAEAHSVDASSLGATLDQPDAFAIHTAQLFALRWGQGRLDELQPAVTAMVDDQPDVLAWPAAAALLHAESGRPAAATAALARLDPAAVAAAPRDGLWSTTVLLAIRAAVLAGDFRRAIELGPLLDELMGPLALAGPGVVCLGAVDHYRALVAGASGAVDEAIRLLDFARLHYERAAARPWLAWAALDEARLRIRAGLDDAYSRALLSEAEVAATDLPMPAVAAAVRQLRAALPTTAGRRGDG